MKNSSKPTLFSGTKVDVWTSYFGNIHNLPDNLRKISVARGSPKNFRGEKLLELAPTWKMLKLSRSEYDNQYEQILARLDPKELISTLGKGVVLLCWEKPGICCHRRWIAEWLEKSLKIVVPEWGFKRESTLLYAQLKG